MPIVNRTTMVHILLDTFKQWAGNLGHVLRLGFLPALILTIVNAATLWALPAMLDSYFSTWRDTKMGLIVPIIGAGSFITVLAIISLSFAVSWLRHLLMLGQVRENLMLGYWGKEENWLAVWWVISTLLLAGLVLWPAALLTDEQRQWLLWFIMNYRGLDASNSAQHLSYAVTILQLPLLLSGVGLLVWILLQARAGLVVIPLATQGQFDLGHAWQAGQKRTVALFTDSLLIWLVALGVLQVMFWLSGLIPTSEDKSFTTALLVLGQSLIQVLGWLTAMALTLTLPAVAYDLYKNPPATAAEQQRTANKNANKPQSGNVIKR